MTVLVVAFILVSVFLFFLLLGVYGSCVKLEKRLEKMEREGTLVRDAVISHADVIGKYMEVTDYLLARDGGAGVYMGEKGEA